MRIFALVLLCLSLTAYRGLKTDASPTPKLLADPGGEQAKNVFYKSTSGGRSWQEFALGLPESLQINRVFSQNGELFLGADNGLYHSRNPESGVWEREDFGELYLNDLAMITLNQRVSGIYAGRTGPYVSIAGGGFYRKTPGTNHWQPMHETLGEKDIRTVLENPDGTIFVGCPGGIYKSADDGKTWKHVFAEGWVTSLASTGGVIVGSASKGLMRSTDDGENWDCVLPDEGAVYKMSVIEGRFTAVWAGGPRQSVYKAVRLRTSADGGQTWQRIDEGLLPIKEVYDLEQAGPYLFCSHRAGISRSADGGKTWELIRRPSSPDVPERLELVGSGQTVFAVAIWEGC